MRHGDNAERDSNPPRSSKGVSSGADESDTNQTTPDRSSDEEHIATDGVGPLYEAFRDRMRVLRKAFTG